MCPLMSSRRELGMEAKGILDDDPATSHAQAVTETTRKHNAMGIMG